jgi:hypothetical protein
MRAIAKKKEKNLAQYSESTILLRTVGFAAGGAVLAAGIWTGIAAAIGTDVIFLFAIMVGAVCGFAVKIASQDRPGGFFSAMAIVATLIGIVLGKLGANYVTHVTNLTTTVVMLGGIGVLVALFLAWKLGGGDF